LDIWNASLTESFNEYELDGRARTWISKKGEELIGLMDSVAPESSPKPPFESRRGPTITITPKDVVGEIDSAYTDWAGHVTGRSFFKGGQEFRIYGENYLRFREISEAIRSKKPFQFKINQEFCEKTIFRWCKMRIRDGDTSQLDQFLLSETDKAVEEFTVYCPLYGIEVESDMILGDIKLAVVPESAFRPWQDDPKPELMEALSKMRQKYGSLTAVEVSCITESGLANDLAVETAELMCSVLRFLSPASISHKVAYPCSPLGSELVAKQTTISLKGDQVSLLNERLRNRGLFNWKLSHTEIDGLMKRPMGNAVAFLEHRKLNDFQSCLKRAFLSYSKGVGQFDVHERLVAAVGALETLFLPNGSDGSLSNVGERLAFFISDKADERKNIVKNYGYIYKIRSKYLHHSISVKDEIQMEHFFQHVWRAFYLLLGRFSKYKTHKDFIDEVDSVKFGIE
jgi:Apea-like HEPN